MIETNEIGMMTWVEYDRRVREENPVVILPVGSIEQHGPHTPLGCDSIVGWELTTAVADRTGALVAPQLFYGYKSQPRTGAGNHYPGNLCLDAETIVSLVSDIIRSLAAHGVKRICTLSSHYENKWFLIEGIQDALEALHASGNRDVSVICLSYYELGSRAVVDRVFGDQFAGWEVEHAGVMTTSVLQYRRPDVVNNSRIPTHPPIHLPPYDVVPFDPAKGSPTGAMSPSTIASPANGKLFFDDFVENIAEALQNTFGLSTKGAA